MRWQQKLTSLLTKAQTEPVSHVNHSWTNTHTQLVCKSGVRDVYKLCSCSTVYLFKTSEPSPRECDYIPTPPVSLPLNCSSHRRSLEYMSTCFRLYRRLLRAHRRLPIGMRSLGDAYVKDGRWCYCTIFLSTFAQDLLQQSSAVTGRSQILSMSWVS
jgi:hypothetical protein